MGFQKIPIRHVAAGSIAEDAGIEAGDSIISINNEVIKDIFDYRFLITSECLLLEVEKKDGEIWEIEVEKDEYEDLGVEFESSMIDEAKSCTNKCIFCFIDQLPRGMRETLYFKDDDSRLSFLTGNYVTLTNISYDDIDRIVKYKMSPINVSVHTTNPELRALVLNNRFAGDVVQKIIRLVNGGIEVNCQIVLCRGINDMEELDKTILDLTSIYPGIRSISVVPVGITKYREGLFNLVPYDRESSGIVINQVEKWQTKMLSMHDSRIVYLADEFYILAGLDIPDYEAYEDFPQIENGVGLIAQLEDEFNQYINRNQVCKPHKPREVSIATGVSSFKYISGLVETLENKYNHLRVRVFEIKNEFFGENVTVTGLLTGKDLKRQLWGKELGSELLICKCMLRSGETVFLDDYTVGMLEEELGVKVTIVENSGIDFVDKILGCK